MRRRSEEEETTATRGITIMFGPSSRINPLIIIMAIGAILAHYGHALR